MRILAVFLIIPVLCSGCTQAGGSVANALLDKTSIGIAFQGNNRTPAGNDPADPLPGEICKVTIDGKAAGEVTDSLSLTFPTTAGDHTVELQGTLVPSKYTVTAHVNDGHVTVVGFNCADAHLTVSADASWVFNGVTKLYLLYWNAHIDEDKHKLFIEVDSTSLQPVDGVSVHLDARAGSVIVVEDQDHKIVQLDTLKGVVYDQTSNWVISPF